MQIWFTFTFSSLVICTEVKFSGSALCVLPHRTRLSPTRWDFYSNILATSFVGSGGRAGGQWHLLALAAMWAWLAGSSSGGQQSLQQRFPILRVPSELPWVEVFLISHQPEGRHGSELPWLVPPCSSGSAVSVHFKCLISRAEVLCPLCLK